MIGRRVVVGGALAVSAALVGAGCGVPPSAGGGGVPSCPTRKEFVITGNTGAGSILLRGLSPNGSWVATSTVAGGDTLLTLRSIDNSVPEALVATIPDLDEDTNQAKYLNLVAGISNDGATVVFDGQRWSRSTGAAISARALLGRNWRPSRATRSRSTSTQALRTSTVAARARAATLW